MYSRAWEISSTHTEEATWNLCNLADIARPSAFLFVALRIPYSPAIGVKPMATPWTDANLFGEHSIDNPYLELIPANAQ
ncbi:hypothetical protein GEM_3643 [Burkholderia cepacia GG4]|uniref:Uncharacterized protein n=1 Tax=Burkholderia cepacia GG4 TaxID=1009846 RepID=A0A9W3K3E1_BURCE|nr:hypothetical protein GEM_3643 [Burkholderia cepacia GG4]